MAYSEALFVAAAAGVLLALQRERWLWASVACAIGCLTRPTGVALLLAIAVALVVNRPDRRHMVMTVVIAPLGALVGFGHVAIATGKLDGWAQLERKPWDSGFDGGRSAWDSLVNTLSGGSMSSRPPFVMSAVVCIVVVALVVALLATRPVAQDAAYALAAAIIGLGGAHYFHCKPRFLGIAFPLFLPSARLLARLPVPVLVAGGLIGLGLSTWWSTYMLATWPGSI